MLLGRILWTLSRGTDLRVESVSGGLKDNAIPVAARARIVVSDAGAVRKITGELEAALRNEFRTTDPALAVRGGGMQQALIPMDQASTGKVLCMLTCLPNGIQAMSAEIPGLVQTSLNLGILVTEGRGPGFLQHAQLRGLPEADAEKDRLVCLTEQLGGHGVLRRVYRLAVSGALPSAGPDDRGLCGTVR